MSEPKIHGVIPLSSAALCLEGDCSTVFHLEFRACPACASQNFALLATWVPTMEVDVAGRI